MNECTGCTLTYKGCGDSLKGVDPSMNPRRRSTPIYKGCIESFKGVDPSMNHRRGSTPIYKGRGE